MWFTAVHTEITELKPPRRGRKQKRYLKSDFVLFQKYVANILASSIRKMLVKFSSH